MGKIYNKYNNIEFFENEEESEDNVDETQNDENQQDSEFNYDNQEDENEQNEEDILGNDEDEFPESEELKKLRKQNLKNDNDDEVDDDPEWEEENIDSKDGELNDLLEEDEEDDDFIDDDELENLLNSQFDAEVDEVDPDKFTRPQINLGATKDDPNLDEKLMDMEIDDIDDDDNLFVQDKKAQDMVRGVQSDGDELAALLLEVPIAIITMLIELVLKLIGAVLEGPINSIDSFLAPVRESLKKLYNVLYPIVLLINNIIGLPFAIGNLTWSVTCNMLKTAGYSIGCSTRYKTTNILLEIFEAVANANPFRFKDLFFNDAFRENLFNAIKVILKKALDAIILITKAITVIIKMIEFTIEMIKMVIKIIEDVTTEGNLKGFFITIIMIACFYIIFYGSNKFFQRLDKIRFRSLIESE